MAALLVIGSMPAGAVRLIACTTTFSAMREACRVYLHSVDLGSGLGVLPGGERLPGRRTVTPVLLTPDGTGAMVATREPVRFAGPSRESEVYVRGFLTAPLRGDPSAAWMVEQGLDVVDAAFVGDALVVLYRRGGAPSHASSRLDICGRAVPPGLAIHPASSSAEFDGDPVALAAIPESGHLVVLTTGSSGLGAVLHTLELVGDTLRPLSEQSIEQGDPLAARPSGLAASGDGRFLFVLTSGYAIARSSGQGTSCLRAFEAHSGMAVGEAVDVPGLANAADRPLCPEGARGCWVATRAHGAGFAYATRARATQSGLIEDALIPLTGVSERIRLAAAFDAGGRSAAAVGPRLEIWHDGVRRDQGRTFDTAIHTIDWAAEGLIVGEGNRLHLIDPATFEIVETASLQTGFVSDVAVVPSPSLPAPDPDGDGLAPLFELNAGTSPASADTDDDGIPDGADPEPTIPSPRLAVPPSVTFRAEAVGRELRAFLFDSPHGESSTWSIRFDASAMPWLVLHPSSGIGLPAIVYMGVDPIRYSGVSTSGILTVALNGVDPSVAAAGSPAAVRVRIASGQPGIRRVLWLWGDPEARPVRADDDPHRLRGLVDLLAAPPNFYAYREANGPFMESLDDYALVILTATAAARGALTRTDMLDYVAEGGALLFLGAHLPAEDGSTLRRWLAPLGAQVDTAERVEGDFAVTGDAILSRFWGEQAIRDGCVLRAEPEDVLVPAETPEGAAILVAKRYGYGRAVLLAAATPLESSALRRDDNRRWARDLISWLSQAGHDVEDKDGDGLVDELEDRNGNRAWDPGETCHILPDSDGDGVPDGLEDRNRNGLVDEDETNPLNPDSDFDGIPDGADAQPLPAAGAPQVTRVEPDSGPAEGGTPVSVLGRNLRPDTWVWFGDRVARKLRYLDSERVLVEAPEYDHADGGLVSVSATDTQTRLTGGLPEGFRYTPRSRLQIDARVTTPVPVRPGETEGSISFHLAGGPDATLGEAVWLLRAEPTGGFTWGTPAATADATAKGRHVVWGNIPADFPAGTLWVSVSGGTGPGPLLSIPWTLTGDPTSVETLRFVVERPRVSAANGASLDAEIRGAEVNPGEAGGRLRRARPAP